MKNEKTKNDKLTIHDAVLAILYIIIIAIGIVMCVNHGLGSTVIHLVVITLCIFGVLAAKLMKHKSAIKEHLGEIVFVAVMGVFSVFALIGNLL